MRDFAAVIRNVPDFPKPGIQFKDITTLLHDRGAFHDAVDEMARPYHSQSVDNVAAIDARGLIFGGAVAYMLGAGFVPIRKRGKLPHTTVEVEYDLEYGTDAVALHEDAFITGTRVLLVDDVIATGGTLMASVKLVEQVGGEIVGIVALLDLEALGGRAQLERCLEACDVRTLITL